MNLVFKLYREDLSMNGFKLLAESYQKIMDGEPVNEQEKIVIQNKIKLLSFIGDCSQEDIAELYNTSAFNEIAKAYCKKALQNCGADRDMIDNVMQEMKWLHDTVSAEEILN